eukprot:gene2933-biopygen2877
MTEHYTRFIVCVPIPNKEAATIANAFHNHVVSVFGAPAESLVDGGTEFEGAFADLCRQCLIDRRVTSPDSAEGNGLTERVVRTIKFCFKKMALDKGLDYEWDELLWSLVLSYNAAKKQSTEWRISRCYLRKKQLGHLNIKPRSGMEVATKPAILKLVKARRDGVVEREDNARLMEKSTVQSIAPCHLQVKDQCDCSVAIPNKHWLVSITRFGKVQHDSRRQ